MLCERYIDKIHMLLLPSDGFLPYPKANQREKWDAIPEKAREFLISKGEEFLNFKWPCLLASEFIQAWEGKWNKTYGDNPAKRIMFDADEALISLIIAECVEGKGRFWGEIIDGIWSMSENTFWAVPGNQSMQKSWPECLPDVNDPVIDLHSSRKGSIFTWAYYLLGDKFDLISKNVNKRIKYEVKRRILDPFLNRNDIWWMGFERQMNRKMGTLHPINNWNPWCNLNCLQAILVLETEWDRRVEGVKKVMRSLDRYIDNYPQDGGCDEGKNYWGIGPASLYDCLEFLFIATEGEINVFGEKLICDMGAYIYKMYIGKDRYVNFADSTSKEEYNRGEAIHCYGKRINDYKMCTLGSKYIKEDYYMDIVGNPYFMNRILRQTFSYGKLNIQYNENIYLRDIWLNDIEVMVARELEGTEKGLYLAAKAGHNGESHNHNDIGQFMIYVDAYPVIIDLGVGSYNSKTFSKERYSLWTMRSSYHNVPMINRVEQHYGKEHNACDVNYFSNDEKAEITMNIKNAYPNNTDIKYWIRTCRLLRNKKTEIEIIDDFELDSEIRDLMFTLITPCVPSLDAENTIIFRDYRGDVAKAWYDSGFLNYKSEYITIDDERIMRDWGSFVYRITLTSKKPVSKKTVKVTFFSLR